MDRAVEDNYVAGVGLLVYKDGEQYLSLESGYADRDAGIPVRRDTIYRLYSMSKPITSAAVMLLMERGCIDLADQAAMYLPGFQNQRAAENGNLVPVKRPCTLRDLLSMCSGLVYPSPGAAGEASEAVFRDVISRLDGDDPATTLEIADRLGRQPLNFHPGEHFQYGTSADILGAVVEVVSGMRFGEFLKKEIFDPLQMNDTGFGIPESKMPRLSATYVERPGHILEKDPTTHLAIAFPPKENPAFESGGAGLLSTLPDYMRFARMLLGGGSLEGVRILQPATVRFMTQGALLDWQQEDFERGWDGLTGYTYGNLMRVEKDARKALMHVTKGEYGWDGWLGTYFSNHPEENMSILIGIQKEDCGTCALTRKLRNLILTEILS